jgi:hypothetical protein
MHLPMQYYDICRSYAFLTKIKALPNIYGIRIVGGSLTHPRSSSSETSLRNRG